MGFIEAFYAGRIDPHSRAIPYTAENVKQSREMSDKEIAFMTKLQGEDRATFEEIRAHWLSILADDGLDRFIVGFRLGAQFTYDAFVGGERA